MHRSLQDPTQPQPASVSAVPENSLAQKPDAAATFSNVSAPPHNFTSIASNTALDVPLTQKHPVHVMADTASKGKSDTLTSRTCAHAETHKQISRIPPSIKPGGYQGFPSMLMSIILVLAR